MEGSKSMYRLLAKLCSSHDCKGLAVLTPKNYYVIPLFGPWPVLLATMKSRDKRINLGLSASFLSCGPKRPTHAQKGKKKGFRSLTKIAVDALAWR